MNSSRDARDSPLTFGDFSLTAARAADWFKSDLAARKPTPDRREADATALLRAGDCRQALTIFRDLSRVSPDDPSYCAW
jgi:hypothetical protein